MEESLEFTMRYRFMDGKILEAGSAEEFVQKMNNSSFAYTPDNNDFMEDCAKRGRKMGVYIKTDSAYSFLASLIELGLVIPEFPWPGVN